MVDNLSRLVRQMTQDERQEAFRAYNNGLGVREIARRLGRAPSTISRLLREGEEKLVSNRSKGISQQRKQPRRGSTVSRSEFRALEGRVARIETILSRIAFHLLGKNKSGASDRRRR